MIPVIIGTSFLIFTMVFVLPGDPAEGRCGERPCSPAYIAAFRAEYNLDEPLLIRYFLYLGKLLQGDLGTNFYGNRVVDELLLRYPTTLKLTFIAVLVVIVVGISAGVLAGIRKGKFIDNLVTVSTLLVISVPVFVLGAGAQWAFGLKLQVFPVTATQGTWYQLLMPGVVLGALSVAYVARLTRTNLVENLRSDYLRTAKSKGMSQSRAVGVHALRNSLIPVVTYIGASVGSLMGGAIITERIFNINGVGFFIWRSINQRDGVSVVGAVLVLVLVYLIVNLLVDLLYGVLDPRITHD